MASQQKDANLRKCVFATYVSPELEALTEMFYGKTKIPSRGARRIGGENKSVET